MANSKFAMVIKLRKMYFFFQIANAGSVSLASKNIKVAQSTLTQSVLDTEKLLQSKLFVRHARGMSLTDTGKVFYGKVHKILNEIDEIETIFRINKHS